MSMSGPSNWRNSRKYAKCRSCDNSWLIVTNGKYQDLFRNYSVKKTLYLKKFDCPSCVPSGNEETIFNQEYQKYIMNHKCSSLEATNKANAIIEEYQCHVSHYNGLKLLPKKEKKQIVSKPNLPKPNLPNAWGNPPSSIKEKPTASSLTRQSQSKVIIQIPQKVVDDDDDGYCPTCCDCEVRNNWGDNDECFCRCYC